MSAKKTAAGVSLREAAAQPSIASALRTLDTEREGLAALAAAMRDGLGAPFIAAVETIRHARGRVIVTGMGKSGHIARKIAATLASTGTPAFFVHAADASHGDLGMITSDDVMLVLSWSGETEELRSLIDYSRRFRITLIAVTVSAESTLGKAADIVLALPAAREACPHNLDADDVVADAACARRRAGDCAARKPRLHRGRFRRVSSRRQARRRAQIHSRRHASGRRRAGDRARRADVGGDRRNVGQGLRLRRRHRRRRQTRRRHHRRRSAPPHARRLVAGAGRQGHDGVAEDRAARSIGERSAGAAQRVEDHGLIVVEKDRPVGIVHFHDLLRAGVA